MTGLVVVDTGTYWSPLGQGLVMALFQLGGFGMMTSATLMGLLIGGHMKLRTRLLLQSETHALSLGDVRLVARMVLVVTLVVEGVVALWLAAMAAARAEPLLLLTGPAFLCELALLPADSRGRWIMGDSGSNVLGALLGLTLVLGTPPWTRWVGLAVLLAVHVFAERRSISRTIEATPALRWLDSRLGVR